MMKYFSIGVMVGWVIVVVGLVSGLVFKVMWEPNGLFPSCVAVDWVSWLALVFAVSALVLAVSRWVRS